MKKNWKVIVSCIVIIGALIFGIKNIRIEKPQTSNQVVEAENEGEAKDVKGEDEAPKVEETVNEEPTVSKETVESKGSPKKDETPKAQESKVIKPSEPEKESKNYCAFSITCNTILNNKDNFNKSKEKYLNGGTILQEIQVEFKDGETVFDLLIRVGKNNRIKVDSTAGYVSGINNIMEKDCGKLSGWMYSVNGNFLSSGSNSYKLKNGDKVQWAYTCDLGKDLK